MRVWPRLEGQSNNDEPRDYLNVLFDGPSFLGPIRAAIFEEDVAAYLVWNRREG